MGRLARAQQLSAVTIKARAPVDQFRNPLGSFGDEQFGGAPSVIWKRDGL